jgi:restriction-modification system family protein
VRRYTGLRRRDIVDRIDLAARECGAKILVRADPTAAPFEFTVKTRTGVQRELVCYAFTANRYRRFGGPPDRHRFQIMYGSPSNRCHELYFDPHGKKTTLLFGVHLEMGLFVGVDPRMHSPTWFPRSVEFKTGDLEGALAQRWHGWERERSVARRKVQPEESLLTETVIAFGPEQFLRYVEFERLASGLDCGERCLLSDRIEKGLSQGEPLRPAPGRHSLEIQLGLPASDILDMVMGRIVRE